MMIRITPFSGLIPKLGSRLLPDANAQLANNLKISSGEIRSLNGVALVTTTAKTQPCEAIYLARNGINEEAWFSWPSDVDVVRAPLSADVESRFYWTGDNEPKYATFSDATSGGGNDYPHTFFALGIPAPQTKPTVGASGGTGTAVTRYYCYTYFSALGEESAPSPVSTELTGKVDDTWAISGMDAMPVNSGTVTGAHVSGVTTFTDTVNHSLRVGETLVISGNDVTVRSVESSKIFTVAGNYAAATTWARKTPWNTSGMKRRLYRTTGLNGEFQLVHDDVGTTYNDTKTDATILGDALISDGWAPPPVDLIALAVHPSGALVGISKNKLCLSEPYQPHAWPTAYTFTMEYEGVGLGVSGTEIGIGTKGNPFVASGVDPSSMTMQKLDGLYPCLSKRSLVVIGNGFMYATRNGYLSLSVSGVSLFTEPFYTKDEWNLLNPESMIATAADGRIYISYLADGAERAILIFGESTLLTSDVPAFELYTDAATGSLYIADTEGIQEWDSADAFRLNGNWKSKDFILPRPINLGAAKIDFDTVISDGEIAAIEAERNAIIAANAAIALTGKAGGEFNSRTYNETAINKSDYQIVPDVPPTNEITFVLRKNGDEVVLSRKVTSTRAFRLPAGYKADVFSVEVLTQTNVKEIRLAETMIGLQEA